MFFCKILQILLPLCSWKSLVRNNLLRVINETLINFLELDMNNHIKLLFDKVNEIVNKYEEISKISGENFNVFKIIDLTTDEVRLHSKFLAELLNPEGSHGQGDIFLKLFIKTFDIKDFETETAKVFVEKNIGLKTETGLTPN